MPGFYRKKRRKVGPSKNEEKVRRGMAADQQATTAGSLSSRFPSVRGVRAKITITSLQGVVLDETETIIGPNDPFIIEADCPGRCGSGSYDFAPQVSEALSRLEEEGMAETSCLEPHYGGGNDACGCVARCAFAAEIAPS